MILIFGGTTEGRSAVKVAEEGAKEGTKEGAKEEKEEKKAQGEQGEKEAQEEKKAQGAQEEAGEKPVAGGSFYLYSTLGATQEVATPHGERLTGALTAEAVAELCRRRGVRLIIDAAHPFAEGLHRTVAQAAAACALPVIRYERRPVRLADDAPVVWCDDYADAVRRLEAAGVERLLALSGVRTIPKLKAFWQRHETWFRVLDRAESAAEAVRCGFPGERLLFFNPDTDEETLWRAVRPDAVLTKESGETGYFPRKVEAAQRLGIPLYAVRRPALPEWFHRVYTEAGLRRRIEELLPGWFPLRSGYTTGTCATVAACAALRLLVADERCERMGVTLPGGEEALLPVEDYGSGDGWAEAAVRKCAGDDPDVTNGCLVRVRVALNGRKEVHFLQGEGVGRVTLPGLGLAVGEPAVNPVPRRMIRENFAAMGVAGADVTVSVEGGAELALKTFNPKLGIEGGISIIGTTGIVRPFSNEAFAASIVREIDVAWAVGCRHLIINSGAKSENCLRRAFPSLCPQAFVHYGNFIGETLRAAAAKGFPRVTMGLMLGKAVKLAEGHLDTHSHKVTMNREFLKALAREAGCPAGTEACIDRLNLARELWTALPAEALRRFAAGVLRACHTHCDPLLGAGRLDILLISEEGAIFR